MMIAADVVLIAVFARGLGGPIIGFAGVLLFIIGFTFGFGSLVWVYAGESFPTRLRSIGSSTMLTSNLVANAIVAAVFLTMLHSLGGAGTFAVFGVSRGGRVRRRLPVRAGDQGAPARGHPALLGERWPLGKPVR